MARKDPTQSANKWGSNLKGATQAIRDGVNRVEQAPGKSAAAKAEKMRAGINEALDSGKWQRNVASVTLEEWRQKTLDKGLNRIPAGVDSAQSKVVEFHTQLAQHQDNYLNKLHDMPDISLEDNINRMAENVRNMAKFRFNK